MIELSNISKRFNGIIVLNSVSLSVEKGTVYGFIGPNGAGKTTTIGVIVGHIEPTEGICLVNGIDVTKNPFEAKKHVGYLPDRVGFYGNMTGRQNLQFFLKFHDVEARAVSRRIDELLEYVGLSNVEKKPVGQYSRGMKQRLGLAHALLIDPAVVIMDEPTNGLDPQGINQFLSIIKDLKQKGKTILISSHILSEIRQTCDKIGIISNGHIIAQGTEDEVKREILKENRIAIAVRSDRPIPKLTCPGIVDAVYSNGSAIIYAYTDIRKELSIELLKANVPLLEFGIDQRPLDDLFVKYVYGV